MDEGRQLAVADLAALIATLFGLVLIGFGLWALGGAILFAWRLLREPESIGYFAGYFLDQTGIERLVPTGGEGLGHYLAWVAVILLLLVIGKLGTWAIGAGAALTARRR
jgi:hypothetical protein